ncbi:MAG TPA: hypothetical protein VFW95_07000 [Candidatus Limnocylindria bacterium]|nr:hypothetical protein [Candidatus Limnocylindria bacterium]
MQRPPRFVAPVAAILVAVLTSGCLFQAPAEPTQSASASATPDASAEAARVAAFDAAICPIFDDMLVLDPRIEALRSAGASGAAESVDPEEVDGVIAELGRLLDDLDAVPDWDAGRDLRYQVITALHGIRARLLLIADDPASDESLADLAQIPYIATEAMDLAFNQAFQAGHNCGDPS